MSSNMDELLRRALMEANALDAEEISAPPGMGAIRTSNAGLRHRKCLAGTSSST